jgi:nitroreductase
MSFDVFLNFESLVKERCSIRSFKPQPVESDKLAVILEAGRVAPTACNYQPQRIKVASSPEDLARIDKCSPCRFGAPLVLVACYDADVSAKRSSIDGKELGELDASIVTTHLMLAAASLGLGSCWVAHFDPDALSKEFGLPKNIVPIALLPIGHPADDAKPAKMHYEKNSLEDMLL